MPIQVRILASHRLLVMSGEGDVSITELREAQARVQTDAEFDPTLNQLIDARRVANFDGSLTDVKEVAARSLMAQSSRRVMLLPPGFIYVLGRMFAAYSGLQGRETFVFDALDEAAGCLGMDPGALRRLVDEPHD